jgi:Ca2+-dependent lipid-binding protein
MSSILHSKRSVVCSSLQGVLRIHFIEAQDLQGKDTYLKGLVKGKSDPYGIIRVGNQIFQSKVIKENLSPKWNEVYEVSKQSGQGMVTERGHEKSHSRSVAQKCG